MDIEATKQFVGKELSYLFDCVFRNDTEVKSLFSTKICNYLGSCQYKFNQSANQSYI